MRCGNCGTDVESEAAASCPSCGAALQGTGPRPVPSTSGLAIASLVLGIFGFFTLGLTGIVGLIMGIVALKQISQSNGRVGGNGVAVAGVVVSGCVTAFMLLIMPAILFPVFARAREAARTSNCQNNLKQIGMGMQMYSNDYNGYLPRSRNWLDAMKPYVKTGSAYYCPSAKAPDVGYAFNAPLSGARMGTLPGDKVMCFDAKGGWNAIGDKSIVDPRHLNHANVVCADGHVTRWYDGQQPYQQQYQPPGSAGLAKF